MTSTRGTRHRTNAPQNFHPFCDATPFRITRKLRTIMTKIIVIMPNPKFRDLPSREAAIAEHLAPTVVPPQYMSPESTATRISSPGHPRELGECGHRHGFGEGRHHGKFLSLLSPGVAQSSGSTQRLASLTVESTPIDWTSGQSSAKAFPLNASMTNQTQFIMMPMDEPSNAASAGSFNKLVTLATEVFDANNAEMVMYCATYDPDPGSTSALLMTPCTGETRSAAAANDATDPCSDAANDASSSNPHQSQIFSYDPSSGRIEPISTTASSRVADTSDDSTASGCAGARIRRDNSNSTTSSSTTPSSTSTSTTPTTTASQQPQNVTLVYVAGALEVPASSPSASITNASGSSSRTATFPQAAVSVPVSSTPSPSMMNKTPSVSATASRSPSSPSLSSSVSATATSKAPASADESLEVEIVGVAPSTTSSSSSTSSTSATTTTTSYSTMSPSLDAQAAASSLANAMVHPRGRAFVSAAGIVTPP
ncbi:hypothetical protein JVT61DRAFT_375 [Boletus reticuloceps]|uniref:Uncharacterized protein n=1 Tax=Boletus reticuloceps TaxID=495285 RepID=A0A8I2YYK3_9AGAM|nr:hypothetical protein JVT61DRAFT_375 [Boletus reticuloceps]